MSSDFLTPVGGLQSAAVNGPQIGPLAAAVVGPNEIAVLEQSVSSGTDYQTVYLFDPAGNQLPSNYAFTMISTASITSDLDVTGSIAGQYGVGAMVVLNAFQNPLLPGGQPVHTAYFEAVPLNGAATRLQALGAGTSGAVVFPGAAGFHIEWLTGNDTFGFVRWQEDFTGSGAPIPTTLTQTQGAALIPYAGVTLAGAAFTIHDNIAQLDGAAPVALPGEPAHAMTEAVAATLANGTHAAVGWVDSGTDYVSLFDPATNSFEQTVVLDWGGASDLHLLALPDGGYVASWMKGGGYWGEVFGADGSWSGVFPLAGDVAGINSGGYLYTIDNHFGVQQYQIDPGEVAYTSEHIYTAPPGVRTVFPTGANQILQDNNRDGVVFWSNDTGNALIAGPGNDTLYVGRLADWALGQGGSDVFKFEAVPWSGAVLDFTRGDTVDLTGMMATISPVSDPIAAGFLKLTDNSAGQAQIWANYEVPGNDDWWLVATLVSVNSSSLHYANGLIT